jgi:hypothetical protein
MSDSRRFFAYDFGGLKQNVIRTTKCPSGIGAFRIAWTAASLIWFSHATVAAGV